MTEETPKIVLAAIHSVPDFQRWYEAAVGREPPGYVRRVVYRSIEDPNEVMIAIEFESVDAAKAQLTSESLREFLDRAGLEVYPPVFIGERVDTPRTDSA